MQTSLIGTPETSHSENSEDLLSPDDDERNLLVYDVAGKVAGLNQDGTTSIATFYRWLSMVISAPQTWFLADSKSSIILERTESSLIAPGEYHIVSGHGQRISVVSAGKEEFMWRFPSRAILADWTYSEITFDRRVFSRDRGSLIQSASENRKEGEPKPQSFCAVHIYPKEYLHEWNSMAVVPPGNIKLPERYDGPRIAYLSSLANGLCLTWNEAYMFSTYSIAIDVDDNYRVVQLSFDGRGDIPSDSYLQISDDVPVHERPSDALLRLHFRQAILRYVLGDGSGQQSSWSSFARSFRYSEIVDLRHSKWRTGLGKECLERYMATRLYGCLPDVEDKSAHWSRWSFPRRLSNRKTLRNTPPDGPTLFTARPPIHEQKPLVRPRPREAGKGLSPNDPLAFFLKIAATQFHDPNFVADPMDFPTSHRDHYETPDWEVSEPEV
ncbi:hypothetical protein SISSUDRAFT_1121208 [Sistotremastrum suecicum HHB10207 ss-3]|uniref:HNH nuclease domain-containing protein n=1 Tax=Sistotremastrum suecicum HHB10207 ss-3 TaxID=1314776 RepID=A0A166B7A3_9AGAM|nr:hypothetical protein SISSUDRAFT_1121208 [Sistotremastrum suecicum HHB10207 ss-3]